jgi:hypothetical protein
VAGDVQVQLAGFKELGQRIHIRKNTNKPLFIENYTFQRIVSEFFQQTLLSLFWIHGFGHPPGGLGFCNAVLTASFQPPRLWQQLLQPWQRL